MKARFKSDNSTQKEEKKKEVKQQPFFSIPFKTPAVRTPFTKLSEDLGFTLSPLLTFKEKINLMQVNKSIHLFFRKTFQIEKLLHHVFYGEPKNAKAMIEKNPQLLLQTGLVTCAHTGETLRGTPLRIAWRVKDTEMVSLFLSYMDSKDVEIQQKAQFPEGYENYKKAEAEKIKEGCKILEEIFEVIYVAKIEVGHQNKLIMDEKTESAFSQLKDYLKPKGIIETGEDFTDELLLRVYELYHLNYSRFGTGSITYNSPKNKLAWQLVGIVQLHLKFNDIQALSEEPKNTRDEKIAGRPQGRTLMFNIWNGNSMVESHFLDMVSDPAAGLGVDYAISTNENNKSHGRRGWVKLVHKYFQKLCELKSRTLQDIHIIEHNTITNHRKRKQFAE